MDSAKFSMGLFESIPEYRKILMFLIKNDYLLEKCSSPKKILNVFVESFEKI